MQIILQVKSRAGLAVGEVERGVDVHEPDLRMGGGEGAEAFVGLLHLGPLRPARWRLGGRDEHELGVRIFRAEATMVFGHAGDHGLGGVTGVDVVAAAMEDDHARVVRQHDAIHVTEDFRGLRAPESAVDERVRGEVAGGRLPEAQRAGAREEQRTLWRRVGLVRGFVGRDILVVFGRREGRLGDVGREPGDSDDYGVPLVVVRVISDSADEEAHASAIGFVNQHAADYSLSILKEYINLIK